jgi:hypothetical protein
MATVKTQMAEEEDAMTDPKLFLAFMLGNTIALFLIALLVAWLFLV